jgi:type I restriction enzyme M protein
LANERKTENIVRNFLRKSNYYNNPDIIVEEQKSDDPKTDKLLKNASKKGGGAGYPEFIIRSKSHSNLIIVIECKADITKHESKLKDKYALYAVDGSLLYASFLSKEYDVLAIGVSGETVDEVLITHNLFLNESNEYHEYFGKKILPFESYHHGLMHSNYKFNQDYSKLVAYTKTLNELLHGKKIKESQRALLISGILIALKNEAFKAVYTKHTNIGSLIESLYSTISTELTNSDIPADKTARLKSAFSFIKSNTSIIDAKEGKKFLEDLIKDIDREINGFMETHQYVDTVSQFYIEFLRYANDDKGLGIVLTPSHITDLFVELADVDKDSVVFDNCCGTGGFLISAMKHMMKDANGDEVKEREIKGNQLVGIEYQDDIYALLISNMIIHRDGRTNIFLGDCFEESKKVKQNFSPTVGLLNPPYKTKKSDTEELQFVLNNLETLEPGGKCISIVPLSTVIETTGIAKSLKKKILSNHTLEAVMSMPEALFHNSDVNVVTCAIVITAHKPHPKGKKTWFGYWRNDGFVKMKNKGRIDNNHTWDENKKSWISAYRNREIIEGLSVTKEVSAEDEWCAEAYMECNYSNITLDDYEETVKKYLLFNLLNKSGYSAEVGD